MIVDLSAKPIGGVGQTVDVLSRVQIIVLSLMSFEIELIPTYVTCLALPIRAHKHRWQGGGCTDGGVEQDLVGGQRQ